jgi:hypothetical protein
MSNGNGNIERIADSVEEIAGWAEALKGGGGRPMPRPPSCFSELARLNACYDDIQQMKLVLTKVMTDLIKNDPDIVQAIIDQMQQTGTPAVPQLGVTDGSSAQPGQVGEVLSFTSTGTWSGAQYGIAAANVMVNLGTLPPGDWDVSFWCQVESLIQGAECTLSPYLQGQIGTNVALQLGTPTALGYGGDLEGVIFNGNPVPVRWNAPQPLVFAIYVWAAPGPGGTGTYQSSGPYTLECICRRRR